MVSSIKSFKKIKAKESSSQSSYKQEVNAENASASQKPQIQSHQFETKPQIFKFFNPKAKGPAMTSLNANLPL